jgi:hypothetical protein
MFPDMLTEFAPPLVTAFWVLTKRVHKSKFKRNNFPFLYIGIDLEELENILAN